MTSYEIATLTLGVLGGLFVIAQIYIGVRAYKAEHERQKKQSTIEYVKAIRPLYRDAKLKVDKKFGDRTLRFYAYIKKVQQRQPSAYNEFQEIIIGFERRKKTKG